MATYLLVVQKWEESEANWGVRPDGYSLHLSEADRKAYEQDHWDGYKAAYGTTIPEEYSRPSGTPYLWDADEETYEKVKDSDHGIRFWSGPYPGSGGKDGWVSRGNNG